MKLRYKIMNSILGVVILAIACLGYVVSQTDDCVSIADATGERPVMQAVVQYCLPMTKCWSGCWPRR